MASRPVRINERLAQRIERLAQIERRSFANMTQYLIERGLESVPTSRELPEPPQAELDYDSRREP